MFTAKGLTLRLSLFDEEDPGEWAQWHGTRHRQPRDAAILGIVDLHAAGRLAFEAESGHPGADNRKNPNTRPPRFQSTWPLFCSLIV
jgi:hypothetical protein